MRLHDTRTRETRPFHASRTVRLYVCGITPYDSAHLGHAFVYTHFDVLVRLLEHRGHRVVYVRNVTDVDDDILRAARERGVASDELARLEVEAFDRSLAALGLRPPDMVPWAGDHVEAMQWMIAGLVERGVAYVLGDGRVYVDTAALGDYGRFAGLPRSEMEAQFAEKGGDPEAPDKRDPLDFLLWQPSGREEPTWPSPWGPGRPGWHIECSAMAVEHLGPTIDIHGGGSDLVFPHHEAEIVQSEQLTGQAPFARFWLHCGMVGLGGEKMSKSVGNLVFIDDLVAAHGPEAVRHLLLRQHYRADWDFHEALVTDSAAAVAFLREAAASRHPADDADVELAEKDFEAALDDDLDVPAALLVLDRLARAGGGPALVRLAAVLGFVLV